MVSLEQRENLDRWDPTGQVDELVHLADLECKEIQVQLYLCIAYTEGEFHGNFQSATNL